ASVRDIRGAPPPKPVQGRCRGRSGSTVPGHRGRRLPAVEADPTGHRRADPDRGPHADRLGPRPARRGEIKALRSRRWPARRGAGRYKVSAQDGARPAPGFAQGGATRLQKELEKRLEAVEESLRTAEQ